MKPELAIFGFIILDTICGAWSVTYYGDRIVSFGGTATVIGLMVAARALCTTFAAPVLGRLTDRLGRRPVRTYLPSELGFVSGTLITSLLEYSAPNLWVYGASRFTFGLTRVCITVANGMVCDLISDPKDRPKALGRNFSAIGVGFLIGSAVGGVVASSADAYHLASLLNLCIATVSFLWTFTFLPETSHLQNPSTTDSSGKKASDTSSSKASLWSAIQTIFSNADLRALFLFHAFVLICNISPQHAYFEFLRVDLGLSTSMRGLFLVAIGFASVAAQSTFPLVVARIGTSRFVLVCTLGGAITTFLAPLSGLILFAISTFIGIFFGVVSSSSLSALSNNCPSHMSGTVNGLHESLSNLALVIGGLYVPLTSQIHLYAPFWISAAGLVLTVALMRPKLLFSAEVMAKKKQE